MKRERTYDIMKVIENPDEEIKKSGRTVKNLLFVLLLLIGLLYVVNVITDGILFKSAEVKQTLDEEICDKYDGRGYDGFKDYLTNYLYNGGN